MELAALTFGGRRDGPRVLITGGVHGDEYEPMAAVRRLAAALGGLEVRGQVTLVPVVNEAAFRLGRRVADDGLDLARVCPGRPDGSVTERVADALAARIRSADAYVDLHTGGAALCVYPLSGYILHSNPVVLDHQRRMARAFGLPVIWGTDPNLEGRSLSVARDAGVPAIYVEYLGGIGWNSGGVDILVRGCLGVLAELGVTGEEDRPLPAEAPLLVEDPRPGSGQIQLCHPAPREGFFEAAVGLGEPVRRGDVLGTISDVLGGEVISVRAERSGVVLVLRTAARVSAGDGLAVVLESDRALPPVIERGGAPTARPGRADRVT